MTDFQDTEKELVFLGHNVFWIQIFKPDVNGVKQKGTLHSEFCDKKRALEIVTQYNGKGLICTNINNHQNKKTTTEDIHKITALFFDVDVKKELKKNYVSLPDHHQHAINIAQGKLKTLLENKGFQVDLVKDTGNGAHVACKIVFDVSTPENLQKFIQKVTALEMELRSQISDDIVELDFITKDINRRVKLAGTINKKDIVQAENRVAKLLYMNDYCDVVKNTAAFEAISIPEKSTHDAVDAAKILEQLKADESFVVLFEGAWQNEFKTRSEAEQSIVDKLVNTGITKFENVDKIMSKCKIGKWQNAPEQYKKITFQKALKIASNNRNTKKEELFEADFDVFTPRYLTHHLQHFQVLDTALGLFGREYTPHKKLTYYRQIGLKYRKQVFKIGTVKTDGRVHSLHVLASGEGKKNIKIFNKKVAEALGLSYEEPASLHPEQLIGCYIEEEIEEPCGTKRDGTTKYRKVKKYTANEGFFSYDVLDIDEAYNLLTSPDLQISESRANFCRACDVYGENFVTKKLTKHKKEHTLKYESPSVFTLFSQADLAYPIEIVSKGLLRRFGTAYTNTVTPAKTIYHKRLHARSDGSNEIMTFVVFIKQLNPEFQMPLDDEVYDLLEELTEDLVELGACQGGKPAILSKVMRQYMLDILLKFTVLLAKAQDSKRVDVNHLKFAFCDLVEIFDTSYCFCDKLVRGFIVAGGLDVKLQVVVDWLVEQNAVSETESRVSIAEVQSKIMEICNCKKRHAVDLWKKLVYSGLVSKHKGQHDSVVWVNINSILRDAQRCSVYNLYEKFSDELQKTTFCFKELHLSAPLTQEVLLSTIKSFGESGADYDCVIARLGEHGSEFVEHAIKTGIVFRFGENGQKLGVLEKVL